MSEVEAASPAERQALLVLEAAYKVAATLEARRQALIASGSKNQAHKVALVEAAERLVNLISLVAQRLPEDVTPDVREHVTTRLAELRNRLLATGTGLVAERAERIAKRAREAADPHAPYPIGLANRLNMLLSAIQETVEAMGGAGRLEQEVLGKLDSAHQAVGRLRALEAERHLDELEELG